LFSGSGLDELDVSFDVLGVLLACSGFVAGHSGGQGCSRGRGVGGEGAAVCQRRYG
jgi:hypothetical protein